MNELTPTEKNILHRTRLLVGDEVLQSIRQKRVIIFGVGGVGSWCAESLVRSGICHLTLVDSDRVNITNINRQLMATTSTVGRVKVEVLRERLLDINPDAQITAIQDIYNADNAASFQLHTYDVIVDAIDSLAEKSHLILTATRTDAIFVSSMGSALKIDPTRIQVAEFWKARGCPLGRSLRKKYKSAKTFPGRKFRVVYSDEVLPILGEHVLDVPEPTIADTTSHVEGRDDLLSHDWNAKKAQINGTMAHATAIFGFTLAGLVMKEIYAAATEKCINPSESSTI